MKLTPEELKHIAAAVHRATEACTKFGDEEILPILKSQLNPNDYEQIIISLYYRIQLWMRSATALIEPEHFQAIRVAARSVFENMLELRAVVARKGEVPRMLAHVRIAKYRMALRVVNFFNENPQLDRARCEIHKRLVQDQSREMEYNQLIAQHWQGQKPPNHWYGRTVRDLAAAAGKDYEVRYLTDYSMDSMYVHSGIEGFLDLSSEYFVNCYSRGHHLLQRSFLEAIEVLAPDLHLFDAKPDLREKLAVLKVLPATVLPEEMQNALLSDRLAKS